MNATIYTTNEYGEYISKKLTFGASLSGATTIEEAKVVPDTDFLGIGVAITGSSCYNLSKMEPGKVDFKRTISLDESEIQSYLSGSTISRDGEKGFGAMLYNGKFPIGWYKLSDGVAKNHYPKHLRRNV